jgi:hypothetical protein
MSEPITPPISAEITSAVQGVSAEGRADWPGRQGFGSFRERSVSGKSGRGVECPLLADLSHTPGRIGSCRGGFPGSNSCSPLQPPGDRNGNSIKKLAQERNQKRTLAH